MDPIYIKVFMWGGGGMLAAFLLLVGYIYVSDRKATSTQRTEDRADAAVQREEDLDRIEKQTKKEEERHKESMSAQNKMTADQLQHNNNIKHLYESQKSTQDLVASNIKNQEKIVELMSRHDTKLAVHDEKLNTQGKDIANIKEDLKSRGKKSS